MKTLLVLAKFPEFAAAVRSVLDPAEYRVVAHSELWEAESLLRQGTLDGCLLDADLTDVRPIRLIEQIRRAMPQRPILVFAESKHWEWEEEAYLLGVSHVLSKPIRGRLLNTILARCWPASEEPRENAATTLPAAPESRPSEPDRRPVRTLEVLREFSGILTFSLFPEALLKQFLLLLREILGVNRAAIFLRKTPGVLRERPPRSEDRHLHSACALGLPPDLLEHFELTLDSGIGGYVYRSGRILRRGSEEARHQRELQKEFELLGAEVAIPILDREALVGVAVLDERVTGEHYRSEELALIFHLLEELGMAIKNSWLHDQLVANHEMMTDILNQLGSGCVVIDQDMSILHANQTALGYFQRPGKYGPGFEFSDLPQFLGSKVYEALRTGTGVASFKYHSPGTQEIVYRVTITPFQRQNSLTANAVLLLMEDFTHQERSHQLELEASRLRLLKTVAAHLAHEIGNALVPLSTHQQMLSTHLQDAEFQNSLDHAMAEAVRRISRLSNQMLFLTMDQPRQNEPIAVKQLVEEAIDQVGAHPKKPEVEIQFETDDPSIALSGDRGALKYALVEVLLNALQAAPARSSVKVHSSSRPQDAQADWAHIEVRDSGGGFTEEAIERGAEPFFTTRDVGLGLGLAVTRQIIEIHHGRLEILSGRGTHGNIVKVSLPQIAME